MSNKKGFISISIIYSFFIIFLLFLVLIMSTYVNNRFKFNVYKNDIKQKLIATSENSTLSDLVISLVGREYNSSQDNSIYRVADQNGVRYEGKDPDNYVIFNNEEWRIIGTFEGNTIGLDAGEQYTKIVKSSSLGSYAWNSSGNNNWVSSSLKTYLNNTYFNSITDKNLIESATWYLTSVNSVVIDTDIMYAKERESQSKKTIANIGLMYPSDYGYSAYSANCNNTYTYLINYEKNCKDGSWLYQNNSEWLLTPFNTSLVMYKHFVGNINGTSNLTSLYSVRPTLYLKSETFITGGDGSRGNPYILDI